jgi:hypothetical protein
MLRREGFVSGRKHVSTMMKRLGVEALYRKPNSGRKHAGHKIWPYLWRNQKIERSKEARALHTTYVPMARARSPRLRWSTGEAAACLRIGWRSRLSRICGRPTGRSYCEIGAA